MATLTLGDRSFPAAPRPSEWQLMKLAGATKDRDLEATLAGMYRFVRTIITGAEPDKLAADQGVDWPPAAAADRERVAGQLRADAWARFESHVDQMDAAGRFDGLGTLETAIGGYLETVTDRPTQKSSTSPDGEPTTPATRKVVSLSRGLISHESGETTEDASRSALATG